MADAIGGYFGTEPVGAGTFPHQDGILLNTGRNALEYILRHLQDVKRVYLPFYTCDVVFKTLEKLQVPHQCYNTNEQFEIAESLNPGADEYVIVNNYFGIKDAYVSKMAEKYGEKIIVDCAQALFAPVLSNTKMFYSIRKYIGVADGGVAYPKKENDWTLLDTDENSNRSGFLKTRIEKGAEAGFEGFRKNEDILDGQKMKQIAPQTKESLQHIDYDSIIAARRLNFSILHEALKVFNLLDLPDIDNFACPMVYPYWPKKRNGQRQKLKDSRIYTALYWPNVLDSNDHYYMESKMAKEIIPLPVDQRNGKEEMKRILRILQ